MKQLIYYNNPIKESAYEKGKKDAAQVILDYIETLCYSTDPDRVKFRTDYGSKGVKDSIVAFIRSKFLE